MAERVVLNDESDLDALLTRDPAEEVEVDDAAAEEPGALAEGETEEPTALDATEVRGLRQKAQMVDRFYSDPAYALQTIQQVAQSLGYTVAKPGAAAPPAQPTAAPEVPQWATDAARQALAGDTELEFMAPVIAKVAHAIMQQQLGPLQEQAQTQAATQRQQEFERTVQELEADGTDWRTHEDAMMERLTFLRQAVNGGTLSHPKYGSLLKLLYDWTTGQRGAQVEAGRRMKQALANRSTAGQSRSQPPVDVTQLIREAKSPQDKWDVAMKQALAEVRTQLRGG